MTRDSVFLGLPRNQLVDKERVDCQPSEKDGSPPPCSKCKVAAV
ncbi:hypothetical protein TNCT_31031, partial [Trichonephila clavata]